MIEQLFFTRTALDQVDSGIDAAVGQAAIEDQLHIACSFEFFKDHLIHSRACIDQRCRNDGQRSALFDITSSSKETFWLMQGIGIDTAG